MSEKPSVIKQGQYWIHNWLHFSDKVKSERIDPGLYMLSVESATSHISKGDIIIRWSRNGRRKTVWLVMEANQDFSGGVNKIKVKDMIHWKLVTADLKSAINVVLFDEELEESIEHGAY